MEPLGLHKLSTRFSIFMILDRNILWMMHNNGIQVLEIMMGIFLCRDQVQIFLHKELNLFVISWVM